MNVIAATAMMKKIRTKGALILADGDYDSEPLHKLVISKLNEFFAPVRKSLREFLKWWYRNKEKILKNGLSPQQATGY